MSLDKIELTTAGPGQKEVDKYLEDHYKKYHKKQISKYLDLDKVAWIKHHCRDKKLPSSKTGKERWSQLKTGILSKLPETTELFWIVNFGTSTGKCHVDVTYNYSKQFKDYFESE